MNNKIKEQLHYFNLNSEVDFVLGDWVVTKDGDVVNSVFPYAIFAFHLDENDWIKDIKTQVWYDVSMDNDIQVVLMKAKTISKEKRRSREIL